MSELTALCLAKDQMREVARRVCPEMSDAEFEALWAQYLYECWRRTLH